MEWDIAFKVLAHEIRSPTGVISGYARMLREGRLDGDDRLDALSHIARASERLAKFGHDAAELARWVGPDAPSDYTHVTLGDLIQGAVARAVSPDLVTLAVPPECETLAVLALNTDALAGALSGVIDAATRESAVLGTRVRVAARLSDVPASCDILIGPEPFFASSAEIAAPSSAERLSCDRGGLGLALIVSVAVLEAHHAIIWNNGGRHGLIGIRLRTA